MNQTNPTLELLKRDKPYSKIANAVMGLLMLVFCIPVIGEEENPPLLYTTLTGETVAPLSSPNRKPTVVIFITIDCPIANGYAPEINRIHDKYSNLGIQIVLVQVDPDLTVDAAKQHAKEYSLKPAIILDPAHKLVSKVGATITPEAAVYDASGKQVYLGRINDRYSGLGDRRNTVTNHNLRLAIDSVLASKPVEEAKVKAIGCLIPEIE